MDTAITLTVQKDIKKPIGERVGDYLVADRTIYYELPYPFPCKFAVHDLKEIVVTPAMLKLPTFLKWHNIDWLRQQLQQVRCVGNGAVLLHGAAWQADDVGYLAVGFCNSGKTTTILKEMIQWTKCPKFCADENVIVDSNRVLWPVKRHTSVNRGQIEDYYLSIGLRAKNGLFWAEMRHKVLPIFEPNIWIDLPYEQESFKLDKIIYLTAGNGKSLQLLTDNEFPFYTNPVLQSYAYATGWDLEGVYAKYRMLIKEVEKCG